MLSATQGFTYNKFEKPNDWPKLKDTFDYQIENGKLLGGNEHLYLSGPVTYEKVGSPTIVDGVVSDLSADNYIQSDAVFPYTADMSLEIQIKYNVTSLGRIFRLGVGSSTAFNIRTINGHIAFYTIDTAYISNLIAIDYKYLRVICQNLSQSNVTIQASNDSVSWTTGTISAASVSQTAPGATVHAVFGRGSVEGSIDLKETYIKINGNLWFYGKNYTTKYMTPVPAGLEYNNTTTPEIGWVYTSNELVKGPVNYTKVGTPMISNGVVSGFAQKDYVQISDFPTFSNGTPFEICMSFTTDILSGNSSLILGASQTKEIELRIFILTNRKIRFFCKELTNPNLIQLDSDYTFIDNTSYKFKLIYNGTDVNTYIYSSNQLIDSKSVRLNNPMLLSAITNIWIGSNDFNQFFAGSIDLNETYIKVNGKPWFGNVSRFQEFIPVPQGTMIGKDDSNMLQVESKNNIGTVGYTVVGSPTITDGVASGFSNNNIIAVTDSTNIFNTSSTIEEKVTFTPITLDTRQGISGCNASQGSFGFELTSANKVLFRVSYFNTSSETKYLEVTVDYVVSSNTKYAAVATFNRADFSATVSLYDSNNTLLGTNSGTAVNPDTTRFEGGVFNFGYNQRGAFMGSIDLNGTYIKANDQVWFGTLPAEPKLVGPVDYTVVGSPTIVDGVASGFSNESSNYSGLYTSASYDVSNAIESYIRFNPGAQTNAVFFGPQANTGRMLYVSNGIRVVIPNGTLTAVYTMDANTWYRAKFSYNGLTSYILVLYDDSGNELATDSATGSASASYDTRCYIGSVMNSGTGNTFAGSIDLNETYIKINGSLWFGKENWNPAIYDNNSIVELVGHKSDYSQYNELGINPIIETDSDEVGTYNVWIDNQKILENQSNPNTIDWSKLALTTGYSITTPSALKAHTIKIEPTNSEDKIIGFHSFEEDSDESI